MIVRFVYKMSIGHGLVTTACVRCSWTSRQEPAWRLDEQFVFGPEVLACAPRRYLRALVYLPSGPGERRSGAAAARARTAATVVEVDGPLRETPVYLPEGADAPVAPGRRDCG
jgi:hypothetical protein